MLAGPGCSSFGIGGLKEVGPFLVDTDGKTLCRNRYAWTTGELSCQSAIPCRVDRELEIC